MNGLFRLLAILFVSTFFWGCSKPTIISIRNRIPYDRIEETSHFLPQIETSSPVESHNRAEVSLRNGLTSIGSGRNIRARVDVQELGNSVGYSNYFLNQVEAEVPGWVAHDYIPRMISLAGKATLYQVKGRPYTNVSSFYRDFEAFHHWDEYLRSLYKAKYYFQMLPHYDDTPQRIWERTSEDRIYLIDNGFNEVWFLAKYIEAEILRQEIAQKTHDPMLLCRSLELIDEIKVDSAGQWLPGLLQKTRMRILKRLDYLDVRCP